MIRLSSLSLTIAVLCLSITALASPTPGNNADAADIVSERQITRQEVVARASLTRHKRQATSQVPCNSRTGDPFRLVYTNPTLPRSVTRIDLYFYPGTLSLGTRFVIDTSGRLLYAGTTDFAFNTNTQEASFVITQSGGALVQPICSISTTNRLSCTVSNVNRNFYTCPTREGGALIAAINPPETSCLLQSFIVLPACV